VVLPANGTLAVEMTVSCVPFQISRNVNRPPAPAGSLNHLTADLGIPFDSFSSADALKKRWHRIQHVEEEQTLEICDRGERPLAGRETGPAGAKTRRPSSSSIAVIPFGACTDRARRSDRSKGAAIVDEL
jgi:hypothetical protein